MEAILACFPAMSKNDWTRWQLHVNFDYTYTGLIKRQFATASIERTASLCDQFFSPFDTQRQKKKRKKKHWPTICERIGRRWADLGWISTELLRQCSVSSDPVALVDRWLDKRHVSIVKRHSLLVTAAKLLWCIEDKTAGVSKHQSTI